MTGNHSKLKLVVGVAAVFFVGAAAGVLGASLYFEGEMEKRFHRKTPHGEEILKRLTRDLDLTPRQQEEIRPIILAFDKKSSHLKEQYRPQMRQLHDQVATLIRERLDDRQKRAFDEINETLKKRFRGRTSPSAASPAKE